MVKLLRWLWGFVEFSFSNGFIDGFVNDCYEQRINVQSLKRDDTVLYGRCSAKNYKLLRNIAHKNAGVIQITKKHGIVFPLLKLKNRLGLFAGVLLFIVIINFLGGFVWNIQITGNSKISSEDISSLLGSNGFSVGSYWKSIDKDVLENLILASFDDCAWVHINQIGSLARVEIKEAVAKPKIVKGKGYANIKAKKDGIIVQTIVYTGWRAVNSGDSVTKGDLLISGIYENEKKKQNFFARASGICLAQVNESFQLTVSRQQHEKKYLPEKKYKTINFFGLKIPLYIGKISKQNTDFEQKSVYVKLNKKELPIGITYDIAKPYVITTNVLSDKELNELAGREINKKIKTDFADAQIISKKADISLGSENAKVSVKLVCIEDIAQESKIDIKAQKNK